MKLNRFVLVVSSHVVKFAFRLVVDVPPPVRDSVSLCYVGLYTASLDSITRLIKFELLPSLMIN